MNRRDVCETAERIASRLPDSAAMYPRLASLAALVDTLEHAVERGTTHTIVRWIDAERAFPSDAAMLATIDTACSVVLTANETPARGAILADIRRTAREHVRTVSANDRIRTQGRSPRTAAETLLIAMSVHDADTAQHMRESGLLARRLAVALHLSAADATHLELAATLHDIGKLAIPGDVLNSPAPLSQAQWALMREHPRAGAEIVRAIDELAHLAPAILAHHERIDGKGYPHGIAGDHIPFAARGVAIVDAFHAMTSHRSYRAPLAPRAALAELARARATQFDATLVDVFTEVFTESALSERRSA